MNENDKTTKEITTDAKKMILGYLELQISLNGHWDKEEAQYVHDLITADIEKKESKILEIIKRYKQGLCPKCGKMAKRTLDPMNPTKCHDCNIWPCSDTNSWFDEILKIYRQSD